LGVSSKFGDSLTGRKNDIWLTPMILADLDDFKNHDLPHRMLHGGLPPFFLAATAPETEIQDWLDAYWAKDIQTLFRLERRASFQKFFELLLAQSGGIFEASNFAAPCEVSRPTIANYLNVLEATYVAHVLRPFSARRTSEIVSAPKVYGFDTGFVCALRGWDRLRADDLGYLWEHLVLNELLARIGRQGLGYWRDKRGHEVDFVLVRHGKNPLAIECKWRAERFDPAALLSFRRSYPKGRNFIVAQDVERPFNRHFIELAATFCPLASLIEMLEKE
jgi:predicted AAA+ superfamily ATPase